VSCPRCSIVITKRGPLIGDEDGPGAINRIPIHVSVDGRGRVVTFAEGLPLIFDSTGRHLKTLSRVGEGPGELGWNNRPIPVPGDSILVLSEGRASLFTPDYAFARQIPLPPNISNVIATHWPDSVLVQGAVNQTTSRRAENLHMISLSGRSPTFHFSGGNTVRGEGPQRLASQERGPWWTYQRPYRLFKWDGKLNQVRELARKPKWWTEDREFPIGRPKTHPPHPYIEGVSVDKNGMLWVYVNVPAKNWRDGWGDVPAGAMEIPAKQIRRYKLYDTMVEVIDPATAKVVSRKTIDLHIIQALAQRKAVAYVPDENGVPRIQIVEFALIR